MDFEALADRLKGVSAFLEENGGDVVSVEEAIMCVRVLNDPESLCVNMLRGEIKKPSLMSLLHLYGQEAVERYNTSNARFVSQDEHVHLGETETAQ